MNKYNFRVVLQISLSLLSVSFLWLIFTQYNNTLSNNGNWISTKVNLGKNVYGSKEFMGGRQALARNTLNLGAWYGYQELVLKNRYPLHTLEMDFYLFNGSYIFLEFNRKGDGYSAIRLSGTSKYPSSALSIANSGKFIKESPLKLPLLKTGIWHQLHAVFDYHNKTVAISVDGIAYDTISTTLEPYQTLGLRGSYRQVLVDNVYIRDKKNIILFRDDFSYPLNINKDIFICLILLALFLAFTSIKMKNTISYLLGLSIALGIIEGYVWGYFLTSYPNPYSSWNKLRDVVLKTAEVINARNELLADKIIQNSTGSKRDILFIGTSQTWGAGADDEAETFVNIAAKDAKGDGFNGAFINAGISGVDSSVLLNYYQNKWIKIKPSLCIINLSNNDIRDKDTFKKNLRSFAQLNKENNIRTVFILEANSPEAEKRSVLLHPIMREVAGSEGIQVIDIHHYLSQKDKTGLLWWDNVHLTTFGHELAGHYVYEEIKKLLY